MKNKILLIALFVSITINLYIFYFIENKDSQKCTIENSQKIDVPSFVSGVIGNVLRNNYDINIKKTENQIFNFEFEGEKHRGSFKDGKPNGLWQKFDCIDNLEGCVCLLDNGRFVAFSFYPDSKIKAILSGRYTFEKSISPSAGTLNSTHIQNIVGDCPTIFVYEQLTWFDEIDGSVIDNKNLGYLSATRVLDIVNLKFNFENNQYIEKAKIKTNYKSNSMKINASFYITDLKDKKIVTKELVTVIVEKKTENLLQTYHIENKNDKFSVVFEKANNEIYYNIIDKKTGKIIKKRWLMEVAFKGSV